MPQPAGFISDEELEALEKPVGFISDDEAESLESQPEKRPRTKKTPLESGISGVADMLTLGHSDEIGAGLRAGAVATFRGEPFGPLYDQYLNEQRQHKSEAEEDNPWPYLAGNVIGGAIPVAATMGAGAPTLAARGFAAVVPKAGASTISNIGRGIAGSALLGSGNSNARPWDSLDAAEEYAADVGGSAALGGLTAGLFDKASRFISGLAPSSLRQKAGERAVKAATGQNKAAITAMRASGTASEEGNALQSAGKIIQSKDLAGPAVVQAFDKAEDILPKALEKKKFFGQKIGEVAGIIDSTMPKSIDGKRIASRIVDYAATIPETEETAPIINRLMKEAERMEKRANMSFADAQSLKGAYKFSPIDPTKQQFGKEASNELNKIFRTEMNDTAKTMAGLTSDPTKKEALLNYIDFKDKYQAYKNVANAAQKRVDANLSNRFISPSDYGTAMTTMLAASTQGVGPLKTAALSLAAGMANKILRERGSSVASAGFRNLATILERSPQALGRFGVLLEGAAKRGPAALLTTHRMLMKDPEYRTVVAPMSEESP